MRIEHAGVILFLFQDIDGNQVYQQYLKQRQSTTSKMSCNIDFVNGWELRHQGAESKLYFGVHSNNRCVIKHRFSKKYRHPLLDKKLTKERTKRERKMIERIRANSAQLGPYMPKVGWSNEDTILMDELVNSETIFDYLEREPSKSDSVAHLIGRCVAELHNMGIIHGDLTTCNLLLVPRSRTADQVPSKKIKPDQDLGDTHLVVPIDFGLASGSKHPEEKAVDLYVLERALLSTHFSDSCFFDAILGAYIEHIDNKTCQPHGKQKIIERLGEVRSRGRKVEYTNDMEA